MVCIGGTYNRRVNVGTLPDLHFVAGRAEVQHLRPVKLNFHSEWAPGEVHYSDCQAYARSNVAGVSLVETYGTPGRVVGPGEWAGIDQSSGPPPPGEPLQCFRVWGYPDPTSGPVTVQYDGTGVARSGILDIVVNQGDEFHWAPREIARVQVYVHADSASAAPAAYVATATAAMIQGESLVLDHPRLNGHPAARVFAQHYGASGLWDHPVAVWYDSASQRWHVRNEDGTPMPPGLSFSVREDPGALALFTDPVEQPHYLVIRHGDADGNPFATIIAAPVTAGDRRMTQPFAVAYSHPHWQVVAAGPLPTSDGANRLGFHVKVLPATHYVDDTRPGDAAGIAGTELANGAGIDIVASTGRTSGHMKWLSHWCWTVNSLVQPILATLNWTPLPPPAPHNYNWVEFKRYGVGVRGNIAVVFHEDGSFMDGRVPFNVWGPYRETCPP